MPHDPLGAFGGGGGFFAFNAREVEVKGRGTLQTYLLSAADPPYVPALAAVLSDLSEHLTAWDAHRSLTGARRQDDYPRRDRREQ